MSEDPATDLPAVSVALPWHGEAWSTTGAQLAAERLPHALLLTGPRYCGKDRFAMALARLLLCHKPKAGTNCGQCHGCELSRAGSHGDFRWVEPEGKSRVIKVDQTRDIVEFSGRTAGLGQRKVVVFSPAEALNINAANALLKCLEEPGAETFLLLVCHRPQGLLPTIRSRCQQARLSGPNTDAALAWLDQQTGARETSLQLYELASGQVLLAKQLLEDPELKLLASLPQLLDSLRLGQATSAQVAQHLAQLPPLELLLQLIQYVQSQLRRAAPERLASPWGQAAFALLDDFSRQRAAIEAGANPNQQLFTDSMLFRLVSRLPSA